MVDETVAVASYNMSFMSDRGFLEKERQSASEGAFLATLDAEKDQRTYWLNAKNLLERFLSEKKEEGKTCIIGLQELNDAAYNNTLRNKIYKKNYGDVKTGSDAIDDMLTQFEGYTQINKIVDVVFDAPGLSIIYDTNKFGKVEHSEIFDPNEKISKANGRPLLIVITKKNYVFINTHLPQEAGKGTNKNDFNKRQNEFFEKVIETINDYLKVKLDGEQPNGIFFMGDLNDRYDAITEFEILGRKLSYMGSAPKSCCYNWDSSCENTRYKSFGDSYGYCDKTDVIEKNEKGIKLPMTNAEGRKKNYRYRGDKVFGEIPITKIDIYDTTGTYISEESDHQMVCAEFKICYDDEGRNIKCRSVKELGKKFEPKLDESEQYEQDEQEPEQEAGRRQLKKRHRRKTKKGGKKTHKRRAAKKRATKKKAGRRKTKRIY